jgi:TRAP-type C4-dicarboxylate transport system substrate-binding protein
MAAMAGLAPFSATAQAPIVMKIGTATINDSQWEWMKHFAARMEETAKGRIKVETYPSSQLGGIPRMIEQTQFGAIQGWCGPPEFLSGVDSRYQVLSAPGLFKDLPHTNRTLQDPAFNKAFLDLGANKGLKGIGLIISGPTTFVSRKPIRTLTDFEGMKVRVLAAPLQMEQVRALKMAPIPMALGEVLPALQQGALDGVMSCTPVFVALRFNDAAKYLIETNHGLISAIAIISKTWFDKLPADLQEAVTEAGKKATSDVYQFSLDDVNNGRATWAKNGGEVISLSAEEHAKLQALLAPVGERVVEKNPGEKALFDLLKQAATRTQQA